MIIKVLNKVPICNQTQFMNTIRQLGIVALLCLCVNFSWGKDGFFILEEAPFSYSITEGEKKGLFEKSILYLKEEIMKLIVLAFIFLT